MHWGPDESQVWYIELSKELKQTCLGVIVMMNTWVLDCCGRLYTVLSRSFSEQCTTRFKAKKCFGICPTFHWIKRYCKLRSLYKLGFQVTKQQKTCCMTWNSEQNYTHLSQATNTVYKYFNARERICGRVWLMQGHRRSPFIGISKFYMINQTVLHTATCSKGCTQRISKYVMRKAQ